MNTSVISPEVRARVRGLAIPVALAFGRLRLTPNALTVLGFGIAVVAAVAAAQQAWVAAGLLVILGGVFDLFDGALARATNRVSRVGAFLDSVFDRAGESLLFLGIAIGCVAVGFVGGALLAAGAMAASFMVSYVRAKSESLGFTPGTGMANVGIAPREVRLVIATVGLVLAGAGGGVWQRDCGSLFCVGSDLGPGSPWLAGSLAIIAVLATITTLQRILYVVREPANKEHE